MIVGLLLGLAAHAGDRDPLPALPVERPLVVPRGWTLLALGGTRGPLHDRAEVALRYGVLPRVELRLAGGLRLDGDLAPTRPALGARFHLLRREPPNTSVAAELVWRTGPQIGLRAARRFGPFLGTAAVGGAWRGAPVVDGGVELLLQVGPLAPWVAVRETWPRPPSGAVGLVAQLSRGLAVQGELGTRRTSLVVELAL